MFALRFTFLLLLAAAALPVTADVSAGEFPVDATWYAHVDLKAMRKGEAGQVLYSWLQEEVFDEVREEAGVDLHTEADRITAFAAADNDQVLIVEGDVSQATRDKLMAVAAASGSLDTYGSGDRQFYLVKGDASTDNNGDLDFAGGGGFFSFAVDGKLVVASKQSRMESLLANDGRLADDLSSDGALLVLNARQSLIQAGLRADDMGSILGWDSNLLRNAKQVALVLADDDGRFQVEAQLVTGEAAKAEALASVVRGIISIQALTDDMDPEISAWLQGTSVAADDGTLTLSISLDPETFADLIE